uniref:Uncharacterized protein n=1 Tax=Hyaloperonospora arabidopsidis (strain Emoy2) TaxID=559515 RepID=M4BSX9_HYAAE
MVAQGVAVADLYSTHTCLVKICKPVRVRRGSITDIMRHGQMFVTGCDSVLPVNTASTPFLYMGDNPRDACEWQEENTYWEAVHALISYPLILRISTDLRLSTCFFGMLLVFSGTPFQKQLIANLLGSMSIVVFENGSRVRDLNGYIHHSMTIFFKPQFGLIIIASPKGEAISNCAQGECRTFVIVLICLSVKTAAGCSLNVLSAT